MKYYLIVCRSLTYAQRAAKTLEHAGITGIVYRSPKDISPGGCGYCVKVPEKRLSAALAALNAGGLERNQVYLQSEGGEVCEVKL